MQSTTEESSPSKNITKFPSIPKIEDQWLDDWFTGRYSKKKFPTSVTSSKPVTHKNEDEVKLEMPAENHKKKNTRVTAL